MEGLSLFVQIFVLAAFCSDLVPHACWHPTVHRKVGLGCTNRQLVRGLFSYKSPTHQPGKLNTVQLRVTQRRANFSAGYKRDLALER